MLQSSALLELWVRNIRSAIKMRTLGPALQNLLMVREGGREGGMGWDKKYKKGGQSILTFSRKSVPYVHLIISF